MKLADKTIQEFRPEYKPTGDCIESDCRFKVHMQFMGKEKDLISINYLNAIPITNAVLTLIDCQLPNVMVFRKYNEIVLCNFQSYSLGEEANKWHHMCNLNSSCLPDLPKLLVQIEFFEKKINNIIFDRTNSPEEQLSNDFENLLNNTLFYDVTMKSAEGVEYKVHKAVLASRSAVLKAHFEHNTTESITNVVDSPLESELLHEVLTFIYSGKAPHIDEVPEKLLAAANYYQLSVLISLCEEALQNKLTVDNAIETLQLADLHSANALKKGTFAFIKDRQVMPAIIKTEGWANLKSTELIKEIFEYMA